MPSTNTEMIKNWILGAMYGAGILIAGSDGNWFPWFNIAGVLMFGIVAIAAVRILKKGEI
jgi:hypothetical protein